MTKWLPRIITGLLALWILSALVPKRDKEGAIAVQEFGRLPVLSNGRIQPLDSLARNSLLQLREKQTANTAPWKSGAQVLSASEWLQEMFFKPELANTRPVFRIDNPDLKGLLSLAMDANEAQQADGKHYAWDQIKGKLEQLQIEVQRVGAIDQSQRTPFDQAVSKLWTGVGQYMKLQNTVQPQNAKAWDTELSAYLENVSAGVTAARAQQAGQTHDQAALDKLVNDLGRFDAMQRMEPPLAVPPHHPERDRDNWGRMGVALMEIARGEAPHYAVSAYARMSGAFNNGQTAEFNRAVADYRTALTANHQLELSKAASEQRFNNFAPFYKSLVLYVLAGVAILAFWVNPKSFEWLRRSALWVVVLALVVHTCGLIFRMVLEGRPPVTNLYSSAIFIGWGACVLGLILERFWRNGIGLAVSSVVGFLTLIIAHHLSLSGDTMEMMRAVLDTNFWLATHVVVITLGYSATFVAGFLAIIFIMRGFFTTGLDPATSKSLSKMVYGIICFATLFSFVGTVLGGIWADQSWGRFWGWDPKENGALLIVLWNAVILHARWGGLVKERGLMNLAIGGNIVTAWSWFGVNMLGIGLHAYGFMDAAFLWLIAFVGSQLAIVALGCLPFRFWRSFRNDEPVVRSGDLIPA